MITWVMGGHETTASLLSWVFYLLDQHKDVLQKVLEELTTVLSLSQETDVKVPTLEELSKMEYLNMVLKETLRYVI
jgi:cytochrome P450 family 4